MRFGVKVWITRRRAAGKLAEPAKLDEPLDLRIAIVTDQGTRSPAKVARLRRENDPRIVLELENVRAYRISDKSFVLSGMEVQPQGRNGVGYMQTWHCQLAPPFDQAPLSTRALFAAGVPESYTYYWKDGPLSLRLVEDAELGRITTLAEICGSGGSYGYRLFDAEIAWMGVDRFQLDGFERRGVTATEPGALIRQSWLCKYELPIDPGLLDKHGRKLGDCR